MLSRLLLKSIKQLAAKESLHRYLNRVTANSALPTKRTPAVSASIIILTWVCCLGGIGLVALIDSYVGNPALIGSFGATAVLLYARPHSDLAQPINVIGGNIIAAFVGVTIRKLADIILNNVQENCLTINTVKCCAALAVAFSTFFMQITRTTHPPAGATALIAIIGDEEVAKLGYLYILFPVLLGNCIMLFVAVLVNNLHPEHSYPTYWIHPNPFPKEKELTGRKDNDTIAEIV